jgi:hypothetical protein
MRFLAVDTEYLLGREARINNLPYGRSDKSHADSPKHKPPTGQIPQIRSLLSSCHFDKNRNDGQDKRQHENGREIQSISSFHHVRSSTPQQDQLKNRLLTLGYTR